MRKEDAKDSLNFRLRHHSSVVRSNRNVQRTYLVLDIMFVFSFSYLFVFRPMSQSTHIHHKNHGKTHGLTHRNMTHTENPKQFIQIHVFLFLLVFQEYVLSNLSAISHASKYSLMSLSVFPTSNKTLGLSLPFFLLTRKVKNPCFI